MWYTFIFLNIIFLGVFFIKKKEILFRYIRFLFFLLSFSFFFSTRFFDPTIHLSILLIIMIIFSLYVENIYFYYNYYLNFCIYGLVLNSMIIILHIKKYYYWTLPFFFFAHFSGYVQLFVCLITICVLFL